MPEYQLSDFEDDALSPQLVMEQLKAHDKRMRGGRKQWAVAKAAYMTRYWEHLRGDKKTDDKNQLTDVDVEVNRLWGVLSAYLGALYPRANRAVFGADPNGTGEPEKAELATNRLLSSARIHSRIMSGLRQALLYPGCGAKVGYHPGHGSALDRVWVRVIPWWEMVLDSDVTDAADERFRCHAYYQPKKEVEKEYDLEDLSGTSRQDFLDSSGLSEETKQTRSFRKDQRRAPSDEGAFVRVLEVCNLKDTIKDDRDDSITYQGRLEIYVLGQGEMSKVPVWMGPLPFASPDGTPLPHIVPLIFNHEPEFPLRGVAHSSRILPQIQELNAYRSFMAMATRKDTRQYVTRKGTFNSDELTELTEGSDGLILQVAEDFERPLSEAVYPIPTAPISANIDRYLKEVENDLERGIGSSPQARGIVTKATAFEVQTVQQYTESDFGMHAMIKDEWLADIVRVVLRALISAMQDFGDSAGAYEEQEVELAEVGAISDDEGAPGEEEGEEQEEVAEVAEEEGSAAPHVDDDEFDELRAEEDAQIDVTIDSQPLSLRDRNNMVEVDVEDLDANFEISFVEGGRTPLNDTAMQQNLVGLLEPYMALWEQAQKGGPLGIFARNYMKTIAERFDLPRDLHPEEMEAALEEDQPQEEMSPEDAEMAEAAQPQQGAGLEALLQMPPDQAIAELRKIFADDPKVQQMLDQVEQLAPEQQAEVIAQLVSGGGEQPPAEQPPAEQPPMPPPGGPVGPV